MDDILAAAQDEHVKLDRPIGRAEFKPRTAPAPVPSAAKSADESRKGAA
jgi:hypothetical protein